MKFELQSIEDNQVWDLIDLSDGIKPVKNKWFFKRKTDMDGNLTVYKASLVEKGFTQVEGIDYDETFSPVVKFQSIRILLAIAIFYDYKIWQMDVKIVFLNGVLDEDVYMVQLDGFVDPKRARKVRKLKISIYGLKQASRSWNIRFDEEIKKIDFMRNPKESYVYKKVSGSSIIFLVLYVDDIFLIENDIMMLDSVKSSLSRVFSMKDLGETTYILGIRIFRERSKRLIGLSQSTYIGKMLEMFNMQDSKRGFLPMSHGISLSESQCPRTREQREKMRMVPYASSIRSIMYVMLCIRPDVSYALSMTSRYQKDHGRIIGQL
jgi:Reverse transcriptase (RNA-dependent DNA polymerase)